MNDPSQQAKPGQILVGKTFYDVRRFGASGDGKSSNTKSLQAAIDAAAAAGGGTVCVPAGTYVTGAIFFKDHITLQLEPGAVVQGCDDPAQFPPIDSRWEGVEQTCHAPLITGRDLTGVAITGRGTIDGGGKFWWDRFWAKQLDYPRPRLIAFHDSSDILIQGVTLRNSPAWTINPVCCRNITVHAVTVNNPEEGPNTDGINPDSCQGVRISDCYIDVGDDCITIKSGTEDSPRRPRVPCEDIAVTNCTMIHGHGGVVIGSEMSGDVRHVVISNCVFHGTDRGIRLKSRRGRGGVVEDIRVANLIMKDVNCPFVVNLFYNCGTGDKDADVADTQAHPVDETTPRFRRIHFAHVTARDAHFAAGVVYGLPEQAVETVTFDDVSVAMAAGARTGLPAMLSNMEPMSQAGLICGNLRDLRISRMRIEGQTGPALRLDDVRDAEISRLSNPTPPPDGPVVSTHDCEDVRVEGLSQASAG